MDSLLICDKLTLKSIIFMRKNELCADAMKNLKYMSHEHVFFNVDRTVCVTNWMDFVES